MSLGHVIKAHVFFCNPAEVRPAVSDLRVLNEKCLQWRAEKENVDKEIYKVRQPIYCWGWHFNVHNVFLFLWLTTLYHAGVCFDKPMDHVALSRHAFCQESSPTVNIYCHIGALQVPTSFH